MSGETQDAPDTSGAADELDTDFDAGFNGDGATTTPAPTPEPTPAPVETPIPTPAPEPEYVQITKDEHKRLLDSVSSVDTLRGDVKRQFDTAFGQVGAMKQVLEKLTQETPRGEPVEVSAEDFAELKAVYPDLAELMLKDFDKVLGKLKGTGGAAVDPKVLDERTTELRKEVTTSATTTLNTLLDNIIGGDWEEAVRTPQYGEWIKTQADDIRKLESSTNPRDAAKLLREYRKHIDTPKPAPSPAPTPAPAKGPSTRQRQIAAGVTPSGDGGVPPPRAEEDDFQAGFNQHFREPKR